MLIQRFAAFSEAQVKIDEVTGFAHGLWERDVRDNEMPTKVINVSRVNYLAGQVLNGGFPQFVHNSQWYESFIAGVRSGLVAIGAVNILRFSRAPRASVDEAYKMGGGDLDIDRLDATLDQLERECASAIPGRAAASRSVDDSRTWGDGWYALKCRAPVGIAGWRDVRRVLRRPILPR